MTATLAFSFSLLLFLVFGSPLNFVARPYDRQIARRIPPPRFMKHYEYRLWVLLILLPQLAVFFLSGLASVFLVDLFFIRRAAEVPLPTHFPFPSAFGYFAAGLVLIVLPMLAFGVRFDRRIRADGPEPPAGPAEVKALRMYLTVVLSVLTFLAAAVAILVASAYG